MSGWIKLHRDIQKHWVFSFDEPEKTLAWIDLLMMANIEPKKFMLKGQVISCDRGQLAVSQEVLQARWGWSRNKIRHYLELLKKDGMISIASNHLTSIITICNYSDFQDNQPAEGTAESTAEGTSEGTAEGTRLKNIRIKELKNKNICANFEQFWDVYDKKIDRKSCEKVWAKINPDDDLASKIIYAASQYAKTITDKQFQKHPKTWLNNESWNNDLIINNGSAYESKHATAIGAASEIFGRAKEAIESRRSNAGGGYSVLPNDRDLQSSVVAEFSHARIIESKQD